LIVEELVNDRQLHQSAVAPPKAGYPDPSARLKAETRPLLGLSADVVISVTELACREPGCPDIETIVAVMQVGERPLFRQDPQADA
jgi:hypothetical protein